MRARRVVQVITRFVRGGAEKVVRCLLERLPAAEFEQRLVCGPESAPAEALVVRDLVREIRPRTDLAALLSLTRLFSREAPDLVHAHTYKAGLLSSMAGRLAGVPAVIFTPHGHIFSPQAAIPGVPGGAKLELLRWITRVGQGCADRITALSEADLEQQVSLRLSPASKYVVIRNGIDAERFGAARKRAFEGSPVIGAVGRFSEEKGHRYLIEAMVGVLQRRPGARLVLVGYGPLEGVLRGQVGRLGLDGSVTFAGEQDSAEVLPSFDCLVQPSLYESQGLAILEAMAARVPVVATAVGGVGDVVKDGDTGILVPPADPQAIADALERLWTEPELGAGISLRAERRVREHFDAGSMVEAYARLYRELTP